MEQLTLGLAIRALREARDISAKDLSLKAGLPEYTVSRIENGKLRLDFATAFELSFAMGTTLDELANTAKSFTSPDIVEKKEELKEVQAQLKALRADLLKHANSR